MILEIRNPSYLVKSGRIHRDLLAFDEKGFIDCPTICCWKIVGGSRPQLDYSWIGKKTRMGYRNEIGNYFSFANDACPSLSGDDHNWPSADHWRQLTDGYAVTVGMVSAACSGSSRS